MPANDASRLVVDGDLDLVRRKLRFRAWRRGTSESDLLLGGFIDRHGPGLAAAQLGEFERLLEIDDPLIDAWVLSGCEAPAALDNAIMAMLREHVKSVSDRARP